MFCIINSIDRHERSAEFLFFRIAGQQFTRNAAIVAAAVPEEPELLQGQFNREAALTGRLSE